MESKQSLIIPILLLAAVVLGFAVYFKYNPTSQEFLTAANNKNDRENTVSAPETSIALPGPDATKEDIQNYYNQVSTKAVFADNVILSECIASPWVARFTNKVKITNNDNEALTFSYLKDKNLEIPAKGIIELKLDQPGIYPYSCNDPDRRRASGFLFVTR